MSTISKRPRLSVESERKTEQELLPPALPRTIPVDLTDMVRSALRAGRMVDVVRALVEWISRDPYQPFYRKEPFGEPVTGWPNHLLCDFWPNPQVGYVEREERGEVRDYIPNKYADFEPVGLPTGDTQLAFWTLEQMIADEGFVPENVARHLASRQIFGIGSAVREAVSNLQAGAAWYEAGPESAGNGSMMRIAPMLIPHLREPPPICGWTVPSPR